MTAVLPYWNNLQQCVCHVLHLCRFCTHEVQMQRCTSHDDLADAKAAAYVLPQAGIK